MTFRTREMLTPKKNLKEVQNCRKVLQKTKPTEKLGINIQTELALVIQSVRVVFMRSLVKLLICYYLSIQT